MCVHVHIFTHAYIYWMRSTMENSGLSCQLISTQFSLMALTVGTLYTYMLSALYNRQDQTLVCLFIK